MQKAEKECERLDRQLDRIMRKFRPEDLDYSTVKVYGGVEGVKNAEDFKQVMQTADDLVEAIEEMVLTYKNDMSTQRVQEWETKVDEVEDKARKYKKDIFTKVVEIRDASAAANVVNGIANNSSGDSRASSSSVAVDPARKAKVEVDILWKTVSEDGKSLGVEIGKIVDWGVEEDFAVEVAIRSV